MPPTPDFEEALTSFRGIVGNEYVIVDAAARARAETATFPTFQKVIGIVRPRSTAEVRDVVRIANKRGVKLYPVSKGKNWGYGSSVPIHDAVLLDLSRMDQIVDYDERLAYVTVEPGVTMEGLHQFLLARQSNLMMSVTGSMPDTSIVGNIVERGVAVGPYGDRFQHVCSFEVVLPNGDCIHTGFSAFLNATTAKAYKYGIGPTLDGLFSQSNLGIVTQMTMWLRPRPACFQSVFAVATEAQLERLVDALRNLALEGSLQPVFGIWNDYKFLAATRQYPWHQTQEATPLPDSVRVQLTRGLGRWCLSAALYSNSEAHAAADRKLVKQRLAGVTRHVLVVNSRRSAVARLLSGPVQRVTGFDLARWVDAFYANSPFLGVPSTAPMRQAYWRKRTPIPDRPDPDLDRCGIVCCAPAMPFDGKHARIVVSCLEEKSRGHGFEPNITLLCVTPRHVDVAALLVYDRDVDADERRALGCHDEIMVALSALGYLPYRLGIHSMHLLPSPEGDTVKLVRTLKQTLDPNDILAPGRYDLGQHWRN